ncbi:MAG: hypothetical protein GF331_17330 [Chitinivibrionales bacterium]|nr:hypothetical protein [Chitinivibrionales bacterium]
MIVKVLLLPFMLVKNLLGFVFRILGLGLGAILGVIRFVFSHTLGAVIGATIGFLLGRKHVGVTFGRRRSRKPAKPKA